MTLFYSLSQPLCALLAGYLGFLSGTVYYLINFIYINVDNKKIVKQNCQAQGSKKRNRFVLFLKSCSKFLAKGISMITLVAVCVGSLLINYHVNYGQLTIFTILLWISCFFLGRLFVNLLANPLLKFYNKLTKRKEEVGK